MASRAACDQRDGYIAGANGPCRPSDLRCIEREWQRRGQVVYYPDLGICGRNHEDGGTIVPCPPGLGPGSSGGNRNSRDSGSRGGSSGSRSSSNRGTSSRTPARPTPAPRVRPPTLSEALAACPNLPAPRLHRNPDREGATGMQTWLWADNHQPLRGTRTVRGQRVTCTATPDRWTWQTGDGASYTRSSPGSSPPRHAAEHLYERKGAYTQRLTVRWRLQTSAGTSHTERSTTRPYRVVEIRGALVE